MGPGPNRFEALHFHDEAAARAFVEARMWPDGPVCPRCGERDRVGRMAGASTPPGACKCYVCRRRFSVVTGTPFAGSRLPLTAWLKAIELVAREERLTSGTLQRSLGVTRKTGIRLWDTLRRAHRAARLAGTPGTVSRGRPGPGPTILALWPGAPTMAAPTALGPPRGSPRAPVPGTSSRSAG